MIIVMIIMKNIDNPNLSNALGINKLLVSVVRDLIVDRSQPEC